MKNHKGRRTLTSRYLVALLAPAFVAGVMEATWPFFQHHPVSPYILAVIFSAWYGGLGPGLLSVAASLILTNYFLIERYSSFWLPTKEGLIRLLVFAFLGVFINVLVERLRGEKMRACQSFVVHAS